MPSSQPIRPSIRQIHPSTPLFPEPYPQPTPPYPVPLPLSPHQAQCQAGLGACWTALPLTHPFLLLDLPPDPNSITCAHFRPIPPSPDPVWVRSQSGLPPRAGRTCCVSPERALVGESACIAAAAKKEESLRLDFNAGREGLLQSCNL
ncbi:hypothetical protein AOLI_G00059480 [Acnodon oligacanthus]